MSAKKSLRKNSPPRRPPAAGKKPSRPAPAAPIPYKIAVLAYIFNDAGQLLLLHRKKPPNQDLYSPVGGKLEQPLGESPYACALREIDEEVGIQLALGDIRLLGIVSERAFPGAAAGAGAPGAIAPAAAAPSAAAPSAVTSAAAHWLMFCFEVTRRLNFKPRRIDEGRLEWVDVDAVVHLGHGRGIPETDRQIIWPLVQQYAAALRGPHAGDFFSIHIDCTRPDHFIVTREHPVNAPE